MAVRAVKKEEGKGAEPEAAAPPPRKGKLKLILIALLLIAGGAGGGAYWYLGRDTGAQASKPQQARPPVFHALENFTVNLQVEDGQQFLQTGITLKLADSTATDAIKQRMPEVRNAVLLLLSSRKPSEILSTDGKRKLGSDIVATINALFVPPGTKPAAKPAPKPEAKLAPEEAATAATPAADAGTEAAAAEETAEAAPANAAAESTVPVLGVLFTSFIVQ